MSKEYYAPLTICSYNIKLLFMDAYEKRVLVLADEIIKCGSDVVCLQECFHVDAYHLLKSNLQRHGVYKYFHNDALRVPFYNGNSGLCVISKYPIENVVFNTFTASSHVDTLSHKGFLCCDVVSPTHTLTVCNTHLQSDYPLAHYDSVRKQQIAQLVAYMVKRHTHNPCIVCGDWNIDMNSKEFSQQLCPLLSDAFTDIRIYNDKKYKSKHGYTHSDGHIDYFFVIPGKHTTKHASVYNTLRLFQNMHYTHSDHKMIRLIHSDRHTRKCINTL